jgi:hypothetical protein
VLPGSAPPESDRSEFLRTCPDVRSASSSVALAPAEREVELNDVVDVKPTALRADLDLPSRSLDLL